jgi:3-O-methylgallate 3,4-dioxygenase
MSPQLHVPPELWPVMGEADKTAALLGPDGRNHSYDELLAVAGSSVREAVSRESQLARHTTCQNDIAAIAQMIRDARLDALIVFTHWLLRDEGNVPSVFLFDGDEVPLVPRALPANASAPVRAGAWAWGTKTEQVPGSPNLAEHILRFLAGAGFDVTPARRLEEGVGIGYHVGFVNTRLLVDCAVPLVPVLLNTEFPPNVLTAGRFYGIGQAIEEAVDSWADDARVGVLAVGGLSHPVIDEELDRSILHACQSKDGQALASLSETRLNGGHGQGRLWIAAAGALQNLDMHVLDYIPAYRSAAGTGCGMGFAYWE